MAAILHLHSLMETLGLSLRGVGKCLILLKEGGLWVQTIRCQTKVVLFVRELSLATFRWTEIVTRRGVPTQVQFFQTEYTSQDRCNEMTRHPNSAGTSEVRQIWQH